MAANPPVTPADRYTRHRWHWVRKNDFEVWEWLHNGSWLRPGHIIPDTETSAGYAGWEYVGEARPPATGLLVKPGMSPDDLELARAIEAVHAADAVLQDAQDRLWEAQNKRVPNVLPPLL